MKTVIIVLVILFLAGNLIYLIRYWRRGQMGLYQWPKPYGRYYEEWLSLKEGGDYYDWLAKKMDNREPWKSWAEMEK